jgi:hypothetical protein
MSGGILSDFAQTLAVDQLTLAVIGAPISLRPHEAQAPERPPQPAASSFSGALLSSMAVTAVLVLIYSSSGLNL